MRGTRFPPLGLALASVLTACGGALAPSSPPVVSTHAALPEATVPPASASATPPAPSPTAATRTAPVSAGAVPDAGTLFVMGADDAIYRYDGKSGALEPAWGRSTFAGETRDGVLAIGRHGGMTLLRWNGTRDDVTCGTGFAVNIAASGACASVGVDGVAVRLPGEDQVRQILPADWQAGSPVWGPDGRRLLLVRTIEPRPGPGMDPGLAALWLMEADGSLRELYRPPDRGVLTSPAWSPDGRKVVVWQIGTTSASFAADGVGITTLLIDVATGKSRALGTVMSRSWVAWAADGRLAFVEGAGRGTWWRKRLVVVGTDGVERVLSPVAGEARVAIAPAWGTHGELGWIGGPAEDTLSGMDYVNGKGVGQRVAIVEIDGRRSEVTCAAGRVAEGLRWSSDGSTLLLLCRVAGRDPLPLEIWLYRLADGTSAPLVRGLQSGIPGAGGFGYYGMQPPITSVAAWSRGLAAIGRTTSPLP